MLSMLSMLYLSMRDCSPDWPATSGGATYSPPTMLWSKRSRRYLRHRAIRVGL